MHSTVPMTLLIALAATLAAAADVPPAWTIAHHKKPMTADETKAFMKRLAQFVFDNHLKKAPKSQQRGMVYEYLDVTRKGSHDQWVQGEGLDTMHDGAWFAAAMVNAFRTTGGPFYKEFLTRWQLPFYLKMLNHSHELFTTKGAVARQGAKPWGKPWAFQEGEKGFIPYWWDDGASVSLERILHPNPLPNRPSIDLTVGKPNPQALLKGYSLGMSNHMAQDIGVMLQLAWLLFKDSKEPADRKLAAELAEGARNLHESRMRHFGHIPMCVAPAALALADPELMKRVPDPNGPRAWEPARHYANALYAFEPGKRYATPGFADDPQYRCYYGTARTGGAMTKPLAFRTLCDAFCEPILYRIYSDDAPVPPGINRFDLHTIWFRDGKPADYRSDRRNPGGRPRPIGSRVGPQNMVVCGWALQAIKASPGIWEEHCKRQFPGDLRVLIHDPPPAEGQEPKPGPQIDLGNTRVSLFSTRDELRIRGWSNQSEVTLRVYSRPDAAGSHAIVKIGPQARVEATSDKGQPLVARGGTSGARDGYLFHAALPYTAAKGQQPWMNGIEHGRYSVRIGETTRNVYLASPEAQVAAWLERELAGGLRTWEAIFHEMGYIPTGMGTGAHWDRFSDTGGYAHLISAAAQWLLCLEGKRDWELHHIPAVLAK